MLIQVILLFVIIGVVILLGRQSANATHMAFRRMFLILFAVIASIGVIAPHLTTRVALWFGVGRGADLLLYMLVIAFIGSLGMQSRRAIELGRKTTLVARRVAIIEAENKYHTHSPKQIATSDSKNHRGTPTGNGL